MPGPAPAASPRRPGRSPSGGGCDRSAWRRAVRRPGALPCWPQ